MAIEYLGLSEINGPLIALEGVKDAAFVFIYFNNTTETLFGAIVN